MALERFQIRALWLAIVRLLGFWLAQSGSCLSVTVTVSAWQSLIQSSPEWVVMSHDVITTVTGFSRSTSFTNVHMSASIVIFFVRFSTHFIMIFSYIFRWLISWYFPLRGSIRAVIKVFDPIITRPSVYSEIRPFLKYLENQMPLRLSTQLLVKVWQPFSLIG